jgi:predicted DsbA family dithiol-disulfide isomerase
VDAAEYLRRKYDAGTVRTITERLLVVAAAEGLPMADPPIGGVRPNTFDAHRLLTAALSEGGEVLQQALADALFRACWAEARDTGDHRVLQDLGTAAGMDADGVRGILAGDAYGEAVRAEERVAHQAGITAVPTFVLDGRLAVSGAQTPDVLAHAVRRAAELQRG